LRLWRIDANREILESRLKALSGLGSSPEHMKTLPRDAILKTPEDREAAKALLMDLDELLARCRAQLKSYVTPMGREMYYRYQESLIVDAQALLGELIGRSGHGGDRLDD
jgi:hypothetical protein